MGCHGHGYRGHGDWHGDCWGDGPGYGCRPGWDAGPCDADVWERGLTDRYPSVCGGREAVVATTAAALEARLASLLQDEVRAVPAEFAEMRAAREVIVDPDGEI